MFSIPIQLQNTYQGWEGSQRALKGLLINYKLRDPQGLIGKAGCLLGSAQFSFSFPLQEYERNGNWIPKHSYAHIYFGYALSIVKRLTIFSLFFKLILQVFIVFSSIFSCGITHRCMEVKLPALLGNYDRHRHTEPPTDRWAHCEVSFLIILFNRSYCLST